VEPTWVDPSSGTGPAQRWRIRRVASTGSTNADLVAAAAAGEPDGAVLVADEQTAGRGRLGRAWQARAGSSLMFSVLLRPATVPVPRRGWVGAILGIAVVRAAAAVAGVEAALKWPNDVLVGDRKLAGVLAELTDDAVVVGAGINVSQSDGEFPVPTATSLRQAGAGVDREELLSAVLSGFGTLLARWEHAGGDVVASGIRADYLEQLATIGSTVTVQLPANHRVTGRAIDVTVEGMLVLDCDDGTTRRFAAGDVVHLRR
jgi:BirA family biotin operon repressor/biotin-[acetyl-CoA-carboxylase] ligase